MGAIILSLAALAAAASPVASAGFVTAATAQRSAGGAEASATVTVRIISNSARIGRDFAPPRRGMTPRRATIEAADGSPVAALVYDFE